MKCLKTTLFLSIVFLISTGSSHAQIAPLSGSEFLLESSYSNAKFVIIDGQNIPRISSADINAATPIIIEPNGNTFVLKHDGKYAVKDRITTLSQEAYRLYMNGTDKASAIQFEIEDNPTNGTFYLKAVGNPSGFYLSAEHASNSPLLLIRSSQSHDGQFRWFTPKTGLGNASFAASGNRPFTIVAGDQIKIGNAGNAVSFSIESSPAGGRNYVIKASSGKYLTVDASVHGRVLANQSSAANAENFEVSVYPNGGIVLRSTSKGKFVQVAYASGGVWLANSGVPKVVGKL